MFYICQVHRNPAWSSSRFTSKGAPPNAADPGGFPDFWIFDFSENVDFGNFPVGFGVWEGLESIGNGCGLQMDGFSAHFEQYESILDLFLDFGHVGVVSGDLTLFSEGPRTLRKCPKGPGTLCEGPGTLREGVMVV